jgi:hypothetical protein
MTIFTYFHHLLKMEIEDNIHLISLQLIELEKDIDEKFEEKNNLNRKRRRLRMKMFEETYNEPAELAIEEYRGLVQRYSLKYPYEEEGYPIMIPRNSVGGSTDFIDPRHLHLCIPDLKIWDAVVAVNGITIVLSATKMKFSDFVSFEDLKDVFPGY